MDGAPNWSTGMKEGCVKTDIGGCNKKCIQGNYSVQVPKWQGKFNVGFLYCTSWNGKIAVEVYNV